MSERPILFNDAMVRAVLSGAKMQTRRPVLVGGAPVHHDRTEGAWRKLRDGWAWVVENDVRGGVYPCPFGAPGDRLWVRECWGPCRGGLVYRADDHAAKVRGPDGGRWRPSIHMPRWASRLTLRVTDVRVERVQDITEDDARAEGITGPHNVGYPAFHLPGDSKPRYSRAAAAFEDLWSDTYGAESWAANPWVWVVSFEREVPRG